MPFETANLQGGVLLFLRQRISLGFPSFPLAAACVTHLQQLERRDVVRDVREVAGHHPRHHGTRRRARERVLESHLPQGRFRVSRVGNGSGLWLAS